MHEMCWILKIDHVLGLHKIWIRYFESHLICCMRVSGKELYIMICRKELIIR
jgi:hypothetical protein